MNIFIKEKLQHGYYIIQKVQGDGSVNELTLVKMLFGRGGDVIKFDEYFSSKHIQRIMNQYDIALKRDKKIVKNFKETIAKLTKNELEALLPSYYEDDIKERIKELDEIAKTKRSTKTTTKTGNRKRNIRKKSV